MFERELPPVGRLHLARRVVGLQQLIDAHWHLPSADPGQRPISEGLLLRHAGKLAFQSVKKLLGLLEAVTDLAIILDSESYFVRPCAFASRVRNATAVLYVDQGKHSTPLTRERFHNGVQRAGVYFTRSILNRSGTTERQIPPHMWPTWVGLIVTYQWVVRLHTVRALMRDHGSALFVALYMPESSRVLANASAAPTPFFFVENLIYVYESLRLSLEGCSPSATQLGRADSNDSESQPLTGSTGPPPADFVNVNGLFAACTRCNREFFWSTARLDKTSHRNVLDRLYKQHRFFTYTVKAHDDVWPHMKDASRVQRTNQDIIETWPQIEMLTSTPHAFAASAHNSTERTQSQRHTPLPDG